MEETVVHDNRHVLVTSHHQDETTTTSPTQDDTPSPSQHKRNLSFRLLYASDEEEYEKHLHHKSSPSSPGNSMTLSERLWLGPRILKFQQATAMTATPQQSSPMPDEQVRNKWLDYLNSFQESTPDVDFQMEQFIKVPAGVETVMSFGFFIYKQ